MIYRNRTIRVVGKTVVKYYRWDENLQRFVVVRKEPNTSYPQLSP